MKRLAGLSALALIISSTSGCGWIWGPEGYFRDRGSDYLEAQATKPMQLPPDVNVAKRLDPLLPIPRNVADDTAKGEYVVPRPQPISAVANTSDYSLQKKRRFALDRGTAPTCRSLAGGGAVLPGQWLPHRRAAPADR
ncbi:putative lipoprotein [Pseudomonas sp. TE36184]